MAFMYSTKYSREFNSKPHSDLTRGENFREVHFMGNFPGQRQYMSVQRPQARRPGREACRYTQEFCKKDGSDDFHANKYMYDTIKPKSLPSPEIDGIAMRTTTNLWNMRFPTKADWATAAPLKHNADKTNAQVVGGMGRMKTQSWEHETYPAHPPDRRALEKPKDNVLPAETFGGDLLRSEYSRTIGPNSGSKLLPRKHSASVQRAPSSTASVSSFRQARPMSRDSCAQSSHSIGSRWRVEPIGHGAAQTPLRDGRLSTTM